MGKSSAQRKEFLPIIDELRRQGWKVDQTSGSHWRARPPDTTKTSVYFAISGEPRAIKNTISDLKKRGFEWPPKNATEEQLSVEADLDEALLEAQAQEHYATHGANGNGVMDGTILVTPPEPTPEERMDKLMTELKEARTWLSLCNGELADKEAQVLAATKARDEAREVRAQAAERLRSLKSALDAELAQEVST